MPPRTPAPDRHSIAIAATGAGVGEEVKTMARQTFTSGNPIKVGETLTGNIAGVVISCVPSTKHADGWGFDIVIETAGSPQPKFTAPNDAVSWMREESGYTDYMPRDGYLLPGERPVQRREVPQMKED